jgi:Peptidase family M28
MINLKKYYSSILIMLSFIGILYWVFAAMMPQYVSENQSLSEFSTKRALKIIKQIAKEPHYVGSTAHDLVADYIVSELDKMGVKNNIQEGENFYDGVGTHVKNIYARIPGSGSEKDLLLLSHYDSAPHSVSHGAMDDASGVATILEGIRVFLYNKTPHKNDIVILFSDAEELGLNGAALFANDYPRVKKIGLVLNFEARGSSGPSFMLMESSSGNQRMINDFVKANPEYPVSNSLMYSIYKMLPNDTDLTAFRKKRHISGFNFANIDSHFKYHTQLDNFENINEKSLAHKGSYLMPLMKHFSNFDLKLIDSSRENVYCNTPLGFVNYSFDYIFPMLIIAVILFFILIFIGIAKRILVIKEILKGFIPILLTLTIGGGLTFFGWKLILILYPEYISILQGFTYNGHDYMMLFVFLTLCICFLIYKRFINSKNTMSQSVAPLFLWLGINFAIAFSLQGASFFILPIFSSLAMLAIFVITQKNYWFLNIILSIPTFVFIVPFIDLFPVGLGLKIMFGSSILLVLCFGLLLPVFGAFNNKRFWAILFFIFSVGFFIKAHFNSGFSEIQPKPNSLVYFLDADNNKSFWTTYDSKIDEWTQNFLGKNPKVASEINGQISQSKYNSGFTFLKEAPKKALGKSIITFYRDTLVYSKKLKKNMRWVQLQIAPPTDRKINRYDFFIDKKVDIYNFSYFDSDYSRTDYVKFEREENRFFRCYPVEKPTVVNTINFKFEVDPNQKFNLEVLESSFDLFSNSNFSIKKRPKDMMPKPFVNNDAVILKQTFKINKYSKIPAIQNQL